MIVSDRLFHWSPSENRVNILREGLRVYSKATVTSGDYRWPYISLSPRPSLAWGLSAEFITQMNGDPIEEWDLWEVQIPEDAEMHVRPFWGWRLEEVKVYSSIPFTHVWFVGERTQLSAIEDEIIKSRRNGKVKTK